MTGPKAFHTYKVCILRNFRTIDDTNPVTLRDGFYALKMDNPDPDPTLRASCKVAWRSVWKTMVRSQVKKHALHGFTGFWRGTTGLMELIDRKLPELRNCSDSESFGVSTVRYRNTGAILRFDKYSKITSEPGLDHPLISAVGKMLRASTDAFANEATWARIASMCPAEPEGIEPVGPHYHGGTVESSTIRTSVFLMGYSGVSLAELVDTDLLNIDLDVFDNFLKRYRHFNKMAPSKTGGRGPGSLSEVCALHIPEVSELLSFVDNELKNAKSLLPNPSISTLGKARKKVSQALVKKRADEIDKWIGEHCDEAEQKALRGGFHGDLHTGNVTFLSAACARTTEKRLYAIDWSDGFIGHWYLESFPLAQSFAIDNSERRAELKREFLQSARDAFHPDVAFSEVEKVFDLARPFRFLRRFIMTARMLGNPGLMSIQLRDDILHDCEEFLTKAGASLLNDKYCQDEDSDLIDIPDQLPDEGDWPSDSGSSSMDQGSADVDEDDDEENDDDKGGGHGDTAGDKDAKGSKKNPGGTDACSDGEGSKVGNKDGEKVKGGNDGSNDGSGDDAGDTDGGKNGKGDKKKPGGTDAGADGEGSEDDSNGKDGKGGQKLGDKVGDNQGGDNGADVVMTDDNAEAVKQKPATDPGSTKSLDASKEGDLDASAVNRSQSQ